LAAAGLAFAAACSSNASTAAPATTSSSTSSSSSSGTSSGTSTGTRVTATLTDFHIVLSVSSFSPGTYTFVAVNSGAVPHALEINGPGVNDQRTPGNLSSGQSANLTVTLQAGSYDVFCPVPGHKDLGMNLTITVGGAGGATTTTTTKSGGSGGY
jgi:uncharacterized cupredoxin-like copper-binding protein